MDRQPVRELILWAMEAAFARGKGLEAPSLLDTIEDLTAEQAAWCPRQGAPSIWEIVNHVAHWKSVVARLQDGEEVSFESDWPPSEVETEAGWTSAVAYLKDRHLKLKKRLQRLSDEDLEQVPEGQGDWSWQKAFFGLVAHDCYHTGQIVKLRQLQGSDE